MRLWALFLLWMPILGWCQEENQDAQVCFDEKIKGKTAETCIPDDLMECFADMADKIVETVKSNINITEKIPQNHGIRKEPPPKVFTSDPYKVQVYKGLCKSTCSVSGEKVTRPIRYIWCNKQREGDSGETKTVCEAEVHSDTEECVEESKKKCPPASAFEEWNCWTKCVKPCTESVSKPEIRKRVRNCKEGYETLCVGHLEEREECPHQQCSDQAVCPLYNISGVQKMEGTADKSTRMKATIEIDLVKLQFGELIEQTVNLRSNNDGEVIEPVTWGKEDIKAILAKYKSKEIDATTTTTDATMTKIKTKKIDANEAKNQTKPRLSHTFTNLGLDTTYVPHITWKSSISIKENDHYTDTATNEFKCEGKAFSTKEWKCPGNNNVTILSSQVCDNTNDCPIDNDTGHHPDEDPKTCRGEYVYHVIPGVGIYVFLGIVAYIGTRCLGTSSEKSSGEEHSLNSVGEIEENKYEEVEIDERAEHFSSNLITIFTTKRTWNNNDLDDDEMKVITDEYLKLKQNGKIHFAYEHLKASADAPTIEVVMKFLLKLEKKDNQFTNEKPVYLYIMEKIPSDNPELKEWIFNHFEQGISYQFKKYAKMGFPFLVGPVAFIAHYAIPIVNNLYIVFSSYFELFKDIIFFLVIDHFDENILQHRYDEVGGINLQFVSWYILAVACGSYIAIGIHHFTSKNTMKVYLKQTDSPVFFRAMTAFFPIHFASFESIRLAIEKEARSKELKQFYATFNARQDELDARVLAKEYSQLYNNVKATTDDTVAMTKVQNSVRTWETVIEHVPTSITIISLLIVSIKYQRIRVFMESTFQRIVAKDQFAIVFAIIAFLTLTSIVTTVMSIRNAKRLPLKPTLIGSMTQPLMILVLLTPKVFLASMAFTSMPYFFPIALLLEFLIIVAYNKANFGDFYWFSASTLATLCTPALYSIPGDDKDRSGTKSLKADREKPMLAKYGKFGHTIVLYILIGLVYVVGYTIIHQFADKNVEALANTFGDYSFDQVFYIVLGSYFAAPLVYGILLYIYYGFGHNYSVFITNKNAMHGEMNAFAETANFETRNVLFEEKAMKPAMPAMSAKPQNVYATAL